MLMLRLKLGRFSKGVYKKLYSKIIGPYKILKKIGLNTYVIDLLEDMDINKFFNVEDFTSY